MPKMKSHSGASKRFKITSKGKIKHLSAFKSHLLEKKSPKRKQRFEKEHTLSSSETKRVKRLLAR